MSLICGRMTLKNVSFLAREIAARTKPRFAIDNSRDEARRLRFEKAKARSLNSGARRRFDTLCVWPSSVARADIRTRACTNRSANRTGDNGACEPARNGPTQRCLSAIAGPAHRVNTYPVTGTGRGCQHQGSGPGWHGATSPPTVETSRSGMMQTRDLKEAANLLVEASELTSACFRAQRVGGGGAKSDALGWTDDEKLH